MNTVLQRRELRVLRELIIRDLQLARAAAASAKTATRRRRATFSAARDAYYDEAAEKYDEAALWFEREAELTEWARRHFPGSLMVLRRRRRRVIDVDYQGPSRDLSSVKWRG